MSAKKERDTDPRSLRHGKCFGQHPNSAMLAGAVLYGQYLVIDPNGQFLAFASLSNGIAALIGN
ncbi:MAG: hypothetical protein ABIP94_09390 [Planctomycetota bacterium]